MEAEDPTARTDDIAMIKKTLRNKFNYNDRQCQTINNPIRKKGFFIIKFKNVKGVSTQAPISI